MAGKQTAHRRRQVFARSGPRCLGYGPDDMPAHVRSALTATQLSIPIAGGRLALGSWQGIYLWEHRLRGRRRELAVHAIGERVT